MTLFLAYPAFDLGLRATPAGAFFRATFLAGALRAGALRTGDFFVAAFFVPPRLGDALPALADRVDGAFLLFTASELFLAGTVCCLPLFCFCEVLGFSIRAAFAFPAETLESVLRRDELVFGGAVSAERFELRVASVARFLE
ncbi:MAG: hypothetical protein WBV67_08310, partial [Candidatus Cybelea sp.]